MTTHAFQAEVKEVLGLVINSLYSNKSIFLRELISNASDALDKLRFRAVTEPELLATEGALEIRLRPDAAAKTLTIEDTGIGMTQDELVKNLGTIAHSGSREFLQRLAESKAQGPTLIGQFGVGFYSAFLVADRVEVVSRAAGQTQAFRWASDAKNGSFTVDGAELPFRGTRITLHLKPDQEELLQAWKLKELVRTYSDFVGHPITLEGEKPERLNQASALWQRPKSDITQALAEEFYKNLSHDFEGPAGWTHFKTEGAQAFAGLLFVPKQVPWDFDRHTTARGLRLYVKRVLVLEHCEELLPPWLRFVRGVIDSEDLPLNVSRELLQDSSLVRGIKTKVVKKVLELLERLAKDEPEAYLGFWKAFGRVLKEGLSHGEREYRDELGKLLRAASTHGEALTSLAEYRARMKEGQAAIYYAYGESQAVLQGSPHLEALKAKGYEVLLLTDPVDEWAAKGLEKFDGVPLTSVTQADLGLDGKKDEAKAAPDDGALKPLLEKMREVLKDKVKEVRVSERLTDSPVCLVVPTGGTPAYLEQLMRERGVQGFGGGKRILEVNPTHAVVQRLDAARAKEPDSERVRAWIELLFDQAVITEGGRPADPNVFARRVTDLLSAALGAP